MFNNAKFARSANHSYRAMFHASRDLLDLEEFEAKYWNMMTELINVA